MKKIFSLLIFALFFFIPLSAQLSKSEFKLVDEAVNRAFTTFNPVGISVAIVKDGQLVYKNALGFADAGTGEKLSPAHNFNIASCTKAFTSACIGLLVEDGKLRWDDKVVDILPQFRLNDPWIAQHMTVTDLLCHRSGLKTFEG